MEYLLYGAELLCLVLFLLHKSKPLKWVVNMELGFLKLLLPVCVLGGMVWGVMDREPYNYGLSWKEKDEARSIALKLSIKEEDRVRSMPPHSLDPLRKPQTEFSIPLENLLEGNHGRFF